MRSVIKHGCSIVYLTWLRDSGLIHLEDEIALLDEDLRAHEGGGVVSEAIVVAWLPSGEIEEIKVVSPVKVEHARLLVVVVDLDVVVHCVPWHIDIVEANLPLRELWCPEVHHECLRLSNELDSRVEFAVCTNFTAVH